MELQTTGEFVEIAGAHHTLFTFSIEAVPLSGYMVAKIESAQKGPKWPKTMDYSPCFDPIFGHFENAYFLPENYWKDNIIHSKRVLKVFQADLRPKSKVLRGLL